MKKICLTLIALCMNFNISADEIPIENVITINNPTHMGLSFLASTARENRAGASSDGLALLDLISYRAANICKLMGHGAPTGSELVIIVKEEQLLWIDQNLNAIPDYYNKHNYDYVRSSVFLSAAYPRKFSKISCTRLTKKDAVKEAEATKEKLQKLLAEIEDLEKKIKSANQRVNQSSRSTASEKKESDVKQNSTGSSAKQM